MVDERLQASLRHTALAILAGFTVVAIALGYWQVFEGTALAADPANPRVAEARVNQPRGRVLDRNGVMLAESRSGPNGTERHYTDPSMVHTIGFHSARFGDTNLEARYDAELRGVRSPDPLQRIGSDLLHIGLRPTPSDLVLTVDKRIHDSAIAALGNANGAIVAIDPKTGAVLALAVRPFFDPNSPDDDLARLQGAPSKPLFNRAVQATYVPGSTFKAVTGTAAIDLGLMDLNEPFTCTKAVKVGGYSVDCRNSQHIPRLTFKQAFAWSSNRVFALTGPLLGFQGPINPWLSDTPPGPYPWERPGASIRESAQRLEQYARGFGFGREIPFDLPVTPSQVKSPGTEWTPELLAQTAFGQGQLEATPLQMALVAAAIANGGEIPTPYLVDSVRDQSGVVSRPHGADTPFSRAMSRDTARVMVDFMVEGVENGYASKAAIPGVKVGGKTGSAEVGDGSVHSWFIGFAPADDPKIAIAVIGEQQGSGAEFATVAGQRVIRTALQVLK